MPFQSFHFGIFLIATVVVHRLLFNYREVAQNIFLLVASYYFYASWDVRFAYILAFSTLFNYCVGLLLSEKVMKFQKAIYLIGLFGNISILMCFKYFNFFIESINDISSFLGFSTDFQSIKILLPLGISFYTFQAIAYITDIYNDNYLPTNNILSYATYQSFFPHLQSGPIGQSKLLLPQFEKPRRADYAQTVDGLLQIAWGLFKKVVVADSVSMEVKYIFSRYSELDGSILLVGIILYTFQIYADFSGYSDMAMGMAKLLGFRIQQNFAFPTFARTPSEYWQRWHISLNTFWRNYIYIPLGGSRAGKKRQLLLAMLIFIISGLWHGANWTFVAWGFVNGLFYVIVQIFGGHKKRSKIVAEGKLLPSLLEVFQMVSTFVVIASTRIFFRSGSFTNAIGFYKGLASVSLFTFPSFGLQHLYWIVLMLLIEWFQREKEHALQLNSLPQQFSFYARETVRWSVLITVIFVIAFGGHFGSQREFIYFQF